MRLPRRPCGRSCNAYSNSWLIPMSSEPTLLRPAVEFAPSRASGDVTAATADSAFIGGVSACSVATAECDEEDVMADQTQNHRASSKAIDAKTFWRVLGERAVVATIVTAQGADG